MQMQSKHGQTTFWKFEKVPSGIWGEGRWSSVEYMYYVKINPQNLIFYEFLNIHKRIKTLDFFKKHIVGIHMDSKATITNF